MKPTNVYYENYARQAIIETFLSLLENEDFHKITIVDITSKAQIARRTFYLYYDSKYDILNDYYSVLTKEYDDKHPIDEINAQNQYEYFFSFWYEHKKYLEILYKQNLFYLLLNRFNEYMKNRSSYDDLNNYNKYEFSYSSGGLWAILYAWTKDGFVETPEFLSKTIITLHIKLSARKPTCFSRWEESRFLS